MSGDARSRERVFSELGEEGAWGEVAQGASRSAGRRRTWLTRGRHTAAVAVNEALSEVSWRREALSSLRDRGHALRRACPSPVFAAMNPQAGEAPTHRSACPPRTLNDEEDEEDSNVFHEGLELMSSTRRTLHVAACPAGRCVQSPLPPQQPNKLSRLSYREPSTSTTRVTNQQLTNRRRTYGAKADLIIAVNCVMFGFVSLALTAQAAMTPRQLTVEYETRSSVIVTFFAPTLFTMALYSISFVLFVISSSFAFQAKLAVLSARRARRSESPGGCCILV